LIIASLFALINKVWHFERRMIMSAIVSAVVGGAAAARKETKLQAELAKKFVGDSETAYEISLALRQIGPGWAFLRAMMLPLGVMLIAVPTLVVPNFLAIYAGFGGVVVYLVLFALVERGVSNSSRRAIAHFSPELVMNVRLVLREFQF
jgi:hypothetical protein